jgi:hypothetical protein
MNNRSTITVEILESRTLYSAAPSPTITADLEAVQAAEAQRFNDKAEGTQTLLADHLQLLQDQSTRGSQLAPLQLKLQGDITAEHQAILVDNENALATRIADRTVITNDLTQIYSDLGNHSAEAADNSKLFTDENKLKSDNAASNITLHNTRLTYQTILLSDRLAITTARTGDDPAIDTDKTKILTEQLALKNTLLADQEAITSAKLKLAEDRLAGA